MVGPGGGSPGSLDPKEILRYNQGASNRTDEVRLDLEDRRMHRTVRCLWDGCNASFLPRGNQRYCSEDCRAEARRVQSRRAQRRGRTRGGKVSVISGGGTPAAGTSPPAPAATPPVPESRGGGTAMPSSA